MYGFFPVQPQWICSCYISLKVPKNSPKINRKAPEVQPPNIFLALSLYRDKNAVLKTMSTDIGVVQYDVMGIMIIILTIDIILYMHLKDFDHGQRFSRNSRAAFVTMQGRCFYLHDCVSFRIKKPLWNHTKSNFWRWLKWRSKMKFATVSYSHAYWPTFDSFIHSVQTFRLYSASSSGATQKRSQPQSGRLMLF